MGGAVLGVLGASVPLLADDVGSEGHLHRGLRVSCFDIADDGQQRIDGRGITGAEGGDDDGGFLL